MFGRPPSSSRREGLFPAQEPVLPVELPSMAADPLPTPVGVPDPIAPTPVPVPAVADLAEGVSTPRKRGGSRRALLDVIAELGYAPADRMEFVRHMARTTNRTP